MTLQTSWIEITVIKSSDVCKLTNKTVMYVSTEFSACPPLPPIDNGLIDSGGRSIGSVRKYACEPGYQAMGNPTIECLSDSTWSPLEYACLGW